MNHAGGGDVTLGHYVGKSEAQRWAAARIADLHQGLLDGPEAVVRVRSATRTRTATAMRSVAPIPASTNQAPPAPARS
jgi:hypothetical protein